MVEWLDVVCVSCFERCFWSTYVMFWLVIGFVWFDWPYQKPDNILQYIHVESNHPPSIIKHIPQTIEARLSNNSANEEIFKIAAPDYENALKQSGYNVQLKYKPKNPNNPTASNNRKQKIIWFNPPFNKTVSTKVRHYFLNLIDKHFPQEHKFHQIFNRNNVKVSYSCTKNMKNIIYNQCTPL